MHVNEFYSVVADTSCVSLSVCQSSPVQLVIIKRFQFSRNSLHPTRTKKRRKRERTGQKVNEKQQFMSTRSWKRMHQNAKQNLRRTKNLN